MRTTIIVGRKDDPHTLAVSSELLSLGQTVKCLDAFYGDSIQINVSSSDLEDSLMRIAGVSRNDVTSIWLRQKPVVPFPWWSPLQHDAARFAQNEWRTVIQSLESFLPGVFWINRPDAQRCINYKPHQLNLAVSVGFSIPATIVTNDPGAVSELIKSYEKIIYKSLSGYIFSDQTGILTTVITTENLKSNMESIKKAPGIYQQFMEKDFEARITVVGDRHFAAFIRTPKDGPGSVDWRHSHFEDIFEEGVVPKHIADCISRFQKVARIHYGAYDFIISPDGNWYFLECNPGGQFLWIENALGYKISHALAEDLWTL